MPAAIPNTSPALTTPSPWRICVAPMLDWSDRHCRYLHRLLSKKARLYTEMVHAGAIVYGNAHRHLQYNDQEHPLALQLGGSNPKLLAQAAKIGQSYGYDEINLNCGCPSERVQNGAFGACLMRSPQQVVDCFVAMQNAVDIPVSIKHRIGLDQDESPALLQDFVGALAQVGCRVFIVHARNAWLKGLSPKENRTIPPLRYTRAYQLKTMFPDCTVVINGGIQTDDAIESHLQSVDGVMLGREAYQNPWMLRTWDTRFFSMQTEQIQDTSTLTRHEIETRMVDYMQGQWQQHKTPWSNIARHMLGLYHGVAAARYWRQVWSDHQNKALSPQAVMEKAQAAFRVNKMASQANPKAHRHPIQQEQK